MQEFPGLTPDWLGETSLFSKKCCSMALYLSLSNTLLTTGSREPDLCLIHFGVHFSHEWINMSFFAISLKQASNMIPVVYR